MKEALERLSKNGNSPILVVDDDGDNLLLARFVVESLGLKCLVCSDSQQALPLINKHVPSLILLNIVMPHISGIEIARQIKQNPKTKQIPLIAVTGLTRRHEKDLIFAAGFNDYIRKPYLIEELEIKINQLLRVNCD